MEIFNAPSREICTVRRERTNTPLQALVTLNDPQFVEAARHLAEHALTEGGETAESRLDFLARRLLARPVPAGGSRGRRGVARRAFWPTTRPTPRTPRRWSPSASRRPTRISTPPTLAAWTMLANELMNLDEVLNK